MTDLPPDTFYSQGEHATLSREFHLALGDAVTSRHLDLPLPVPFADLPELTQARLPRAIVDIARNTGFVALRIAQLTPTAGSLRFFAITSQTKLDSLYKPRWRPGYSVAGEHPELPETFTSWWRMSRQHRLPIEELRGLVRYVNSLAAQG